jgi:SAM-dependent methyltransferase
MAWGVWQPESQLGVLGEVAGRTVLELGCGGAQWSVALARAGARVIGLELSEGRLAHARQRVRATGVLGGQLLSRCPAAGLVASLAGRMHLTAAPELTTEALRSRRAFMSTSHRVITVGKTMVRTLLRVVGSPTAAWSRPATIDPIPATTTTQPSQRGYSRLQATANP